jgi:hypothetical protein
MVNLEKYNFEMFSPDGNKACQSLVKKLFKKIEGKTRLTEEDVYKHIRDGIEEVAEKHEEVYDTEPGWHIQELVNKKLAEVGYGYTVSRYDFC